MKFSLEQSFELIMNLILYSGLLTIVYQCVNNVHRF